MAATREDGEGSVDDHWSWSLPPAAPCRSPGCPEPVRWKGIERFARAFDSESEDLFCSHTCEAQFWEFQEDLREEIRQLLRARQEEPELWQDRRPEWDERFHLAWWHLARYMGVRPHATDPSKAAWHEHYYALGLMISRAAEWESRLGVVLAHLMDEPVEKYRRTKPQHLIEKFEENAHKWPHLQSRIHKMCDAAKGEGGALRLRNWLVHSNATLSWSGERAVLNKFDNTTQQVDQRSVTVDQTQRLAALFRWLLDLLGRILSDSDPDEAPTVYADPLGPPPPIGAEVAEEEISDRFTARRYRERAILMSGPSSAETLVTLAELRPKVTVLLTQTGGTKPDGEPLTGFTTEAVRLGTRGAVAAAILCASSCELLAESLDRPPATAVALVSRVVPWRDAGGVTVNAVLSAYVNNNPTQALTWIEQLREEGLSEGLARGLGERLIYCVESAALLSSRPAEEFARTYVDRFFDGLGA